MTKCAITLLAVLAAAVTASAATITVAYDGSGMYYHIQEGIDAASPGDTVEVAAGTYVGPLDRDLDFGGVAMSLVAPAGWSATLIDCDGAGRGFFFGSGEDTTTLVSGFHIMNAVADSGAGAFCRNGSSPKFLECRFEACTATELGGGLCCRGSSPVLRDCSFIENEAWGGYYAYGGAMVCWSGSAPVVTGTRFESNLGQRGSGAVYCYDSPATFLQCEFMSNNIGTYGNSGAAVGLFSSNGVTFADCRFADNGLAETAVGGAIYATECDLTVTDCEFTGNRAGQGAGIHFTTGSSGAVSGCTLADNDSDWSSAAGVSFFFGSEPTISGCTFVLNHDESLVFNGSSPVVEYCILASTTNGTPTYCTDAAPDIHHCFVYGNAGGDTLCGGNEHDIVYEDALLCDPEGGDYTLCADSPCLPGVTWPSLVGAHGEGCGACGSAVEPSTWGALKARFR